MISPNKGIKVSFFGIGGTVFSQAFKQISFDSSSTVHQAKGAIKTARSKDWRKLSQCPARHWTISRQLRFVTKHRFLDFIQMLSVIEPCRDRPILPTHMMTGHT